MAFDPDKYLASSKPAEPVSFNPDQYLSNTSASTQTQGPRAGMRFTPDSADELQVQRDRESSIKRGDKLVGEKGIGTLGAIGRGAADEFFAGKGPELVGMAKSVAGGPDVLQSIQQEKDITASLEENRPIATTIGKGIGFGLGIGGAIAKQAEKAVVKYLPKLSTETFKNLWMKTVLQGAAGFGAFEGAKGVVKGAENGPVEALKQGAAGAITGTATGAVFPGVVTPLAQGAKVATKAGASLISKAAIAAANKSKNILPDDIKFQISNLPMVQKIRQSGAAEVFAEGEKKIVSAVNKSVDKLNKTLDMSKKYIEAGLKKLSDDNQAVKTSAANVLSSGIDRSRKDMGKAYSEAIEPILKDAAATGLKVDLSETRKQVISFLRENGALEADGVLRHASDYAQTFPKQFNVLADLYQRLAGFQALKLKNLDSPLLVPFENAITIKKGLANAANFAKPANQNTGITRVLYSNIRSAIEAADDRIIGANQAYASAKTNLDALLNILPKKGTSFESFINSLGSDNKQMLTGVFKKFKGQINDDVDAAIDNAVKFAEKKTQLKGIKWKGDFNDVDALAKIIQALPDAAKVATVGKVSQKGIDSLYKAFGRVVDKSNVEKLLRNLDAMKETGNLNRVELFETAVKDLGLENVLIKSMAARRVSRLFPAMENAVQLVAAGVKTGSQASLSTVGALKESGIKIMARVIDRMYAASQWKIDEALKHAPVAIKKSAEKRGSRYAMSLWLQTKYGDKQVDNILRMIDEKSSIDDMEENKKAEGIRSEIDNKINNIVIDSQLN